MKYISLIFIITQFVILFFNGHAENQLYSNITTTQRDNYNGVIYGRVWGPTNEPAQGAYIIVTDLEVSKLYGEAISIKKPGPEDGSYQITDLPINTDLYVFTFHDNVPGYYAQRKIRLDRNEIKKVNMIIDINFSNTGFITGSTDAGSTMAGFILRITKLLNNASNTQKANDLIKKLKNLLGKMPVGLVAYYPFNGSANDVSGNSNNGIVYGATLSTDRFGNSNKAYRFDGVNDYIKIGDSPSLHFGNGDFTLACWFKTKTLDYLIHKGGTGGGSISWQLAIGTDDRVSFSGDWANLNPPTFGVGGTTVITDDNWHLAVGIRRGNKIEIYIDGILERNRELGISASADTNRPMVFGVRNDLRSYTFFKGKIDDIRIYNRALSKNEISLLLNE